MAKLSIPKAPAAKPKTIKVKDFSVGSRNPGNIPSLKRSTAPKAKSTYTPVPKDTFGKMQPSMKTAFEVLGQVDFANQEFMKKPIILPANIHTPKSESKKEKSLLSELL